MSKQTPLNPSNKAQFEEQSKSAFNDENFFEFQWNLYQKVMQCNYMEHREIYAAIRKFLGYSFENPFSFLDLGCGDASCIVPILSDMKVEFYQGVDLSEVALSIAQKNLSGISGEQKFVLGDFSQILPELSTNQPEQFDLVFASFSLHHLSLEEKEKAASEIAKLLKNQGIFLMIDVFRLSGESREDYLDRYLSNVQKNWSALTPEEFALVENHIVSSDFPETLETWQSFAQKYGFERWDCLHQDSQKIGHILAFYKV